MICSGDHHGIIPSARIIRRIIVVDVAEAGKIVRKM